MYVPAHLEEGWLDDLPGKAWRMADAPMESVDGLLKAIVGIEIGITGIGGKSKVSRNREERDRVGADEELGKRGRQAMSSAMLNP